MKGIVVIINIKIHQDMADILLILIMNFIQGIMINKKKKSFFLLIIFLFFQKKRTTNK